MPMLLAAFALAVAIQTPTVTLVLCDVSGALRFDGPVLRREVETLLEGAGLDVRFRHVAPGAGFDTRPNEILVVLLPTELRNRSRERVLGMVIGDHRFPSPVWVSVPNVGWLIGISAREVARASVLERALGRVIAHEVVHAFVPDLPHAATGLMGRAVDRRTLTSADGRLDDDCLAAVARALEDPALRRHIGGPAVAALTAAP